MEYLNKRTQRFIQERLPWESRVPYSKQKQSKVCLMFHSPQTEEVFIWKRHSILFWQKEKKFVTTYSLANVKLYPFHDSPAWVAQWWVCRTHDQMVVSSIPRWGKFSFRRIFCLSPLEKHVRKVVGDFGKSQETHMSHLPPWYDLSC